MGTNPLSPLSLYEPMFAFGSPTVLLLQLIGAGGAGNQSLDCPSMDLPAIAMLSALVLMAF